MSTALRQLLHHVDTGGDRIAFAIEGSTLTWAQLDDASRRYAASLHAVGVRPGDRVACLLPTGLALVVALVGNCRAGVVHVPINDRYRTREIAHILTDSGAVVLLIGADGAAVDAVAELPDAALPTRVFVAGERGSALFGGRCDEGRFADLLTGPRDEGSPPVDDDALSLLIYTSGTTGRSKGVELTVANVVAGIDALTRLWCWTRDDVLVLALPLFHVHGLCIGLHGTLLRGCRADLAPRFDPQRVASAIESGGTIFMGVPTMYARLVEAMDVEPGFGDRLRPARLFTSGSAALSPSIFERFEAETGHRILERYGMSETLLTLSNPYDGERRPGTVGQPVPGCEIALFDDEGQPCPPGTVGEIHARGPSVMHRYWKAPEQSAAAFRDGWFRTGDAAVLSDDGYVSIVGRRSVDVIKSGGYKISAREIEEALERAPEIAEAAVIGIPDPVWGERVVAAVVVAGPGVASDVLVDAVRRQCDSELAEYKRVRAIVVVDALPRNALGKVQKHQLKSFDFDLAT